MTVMDLAREERADLVTLLESLTPSQWDAPTLCADWRVRDVVAHMVSYDDVSVLDVVRRLVRARLSPSGMNAAAVSELAGHSPQELIDLLRSHESPSGLPAQLGGAISLADTLIHHQDIRRPLGLPREVPADRLRAAMQLARFAPPLRGFWHVRGVRVVATDLDWSFGRGAEARGPGEAVLMALAGRSGAAADLEGPGADTLARRLG